LNEQRERKELPKMMQFRFEELEVWDLSLQLIDDVYLLLNKYPDDERFDLVRQGRKSVTSISLNIAEGSIRSKKEFSQFIRIALGSLVETVANLKIGIRRQYITQEDFDSVNSIEPLYFKLIKLRKSFQ
jgi:four helix bundle protein